MTIQNRVPARASNAAYSIWCFANFVAVQLLHRTLASFGSLHFKMDLHRSGIAVLDITLLVYLLCKYHYTSASSSGRPISAHIYLIMMTFCCCSSTWNVQQTQHQVFHGCRPQIFSSIWLNLLGCACHTSPESCIITVAVTGAGAGAERMVNHNNLSCQQ